MGKAMHDDFADASLNLLKNYATRLTVCSAQPTSYAEANATYALADVTIDSSDFTGPANGDTSGRKITVGAQSGVTVDSSGTATHVALLDVANSKLLYVTTCTSQALTAGNTLSTSAWDVEIADPA